MVNYGDILTMKILDYFEALADLLMRAVAVGMVVAVVTLLVSAR
jgi:hypothetical protein